MAWVTMHMISTENMLFYRFGERSLLEQHLNNHYTEHELLYNSSSQFPHSARLKTKTGDKSHAYALTT